MSFIDLLKTLDQTPRPQDKARALTLYFQAAPHGDAAWALHLATGKRLKRTITPAQIKEWSARAAAIPDWLAEESFTAVGDLAEAAALLIPEPPAPSASPENPLQNLSLKQLIEDHLPSLSRLDNHALQKRITRVWALSSVPQRILFNRLLLGATGFGLKLPATLVLKALADAFGVSHAQIATRLTVDWRPTPDAFARLITKDATVQTLGDAGLPYPFQSAIPYTLPASSLSPSPSGPLFTRSPEPETRNPNPSLPERAEWLYDGLRVQLIKRQGRWLLWTHSSIPAPHKANQPVTRSFPEFALGALALPDGTVIDAVIAATIGVWPKVRPQHSASLLSRLQSKERELSLWEISSQTPANEDDLEQGSMLIAIDLLEHQGQDTRRLPLLQRLGLLASLITPLTREHPFRLADAWPAESWEACDRARRQARSLAYLGVILKSLTAPYTDPPAPWLTLKADPLVIDCVLTAAQPSPSGRLQYTLALWSGNDLVPVAKVDSRLSDQEQKHIDQFIRANTIAKHGPVRTVTPHLVLQVAFDSAIPAPRHKSGLTLINPTLRALLPYPQARAASLQALKHLAGL
jgi:DNA ligase 1